ncbi:hypothetical protein HDF18_08485 [Mucilaginibacter sp. X5P1]|uniref:hypothetical protein n=1 Tax=Mucilaginibacter sp. X5P1 TaxID=2723088 RepID=UPI001617D3C5|nr:hypothetical protein [Mucilaginibacter sp. X5P1]MBB6137694.1 hypothetical protein [Mucilaginibacter sp. X5P1]
MSATYNWTYKAGTMFPLRYDGGPANDYIAESADDVRPSNAIYIALFGNDTTGNGSRQYPLRTIAAAFAAYPGFRNMFIVASGVYREAVNGGMLLVGDGDVVIDGTGLNPYFFTSTGNFCVSYNIRFRGFVFFNTVDYTSSHTNSIFEGVSPGSPGYGNANLLQKSIVLNTTVFFDGGDSGNNIQFNQIINNTFSGSNVVFQNNVYNQQLGVNTCIFYQCNIYFASIPNFIDYCLFYQCNFRFDTSIVNPFPATFYPNVPPGFTQYANIAALQAACNSAYGSSLVFTNCQMTDPLFNNPAIGDYSLAFASPAKNMSYQGTYAGAESIAYPVKVSATETGGSFDFSSIVNLSVTNNSVTLTDPTQNGSIKTKLIVNSSGRQIEKLPIYAYNADRNGQYIDSIADLSATYMNAGDTLDTPVPYLVENGALSYNGNSYQPGERLTTVTGITTFSSVNGGTLREITEAPQRHTIMARFSDGGAIVNAGSALIDGYWYYISAGSVSYNGIVYNTGSSFKAVNTTPFSGTGTVIIALGTEAFQHYEPGIQPTSNNEGDSRLGTIIRGNGDPAYVRGGYNIQEFPINSRFIQLYYIINVNNLKP